MVSGLDDVVAAETVLSDIDGQAGRLIIRGYSLDDLAGNQPFEDVVTLLWDGLLGEPQADRTAVSPAGAGARKDLSKQLGTARQQVFTHLQAADKQLLRLPPVEAVRSLLTRIADQDDIATALQLVAAPAVFTPGILRLQQGLAPIEPDPNIGHAADMLRMTRGTLPTKEQAAALDRYLVTIIDHGLNASTFTARVVASTRAGLTAAVVAALSALMGPLHGGAPGPVLDALDSIGSADRAHAWLQDALARGDRLMGFGHRVYRVRDPRTDSVKEAIRDLTRSGQVDPERLRLAEAVESTALELLARKKPARPLQTNVEFYTALLLEALGFPREAFTGVFASGRVAGWIAHAREQALGGRLIRPQSRYVGPQPKPSQAA
jgi:citrate synthase